MAKTVVILGSKNWKQWLCEALARIEMKVDTVLAKETQIMATIDEVNAKADALGTTLTNIAGDTQSLKDEVQKLKDQIAAGNPVSQAQLDALDSKLSGILSQAQGLDASVP